jgi:hypothetical protein
MSTYCLLTLFFFFFFNSFHCEIRAHTLRSTSRNHHRNLVDTTMEYFCDICDCYVPPANWDEHVNGRRHQSIIDDLSGKQSSGGGDDHSNDEWDDDGNVEYCDCQCCDEGFNVVHADSIAYRQGSIRNEFSDGTPLEHGIYNLGALPGHYKYCDVWDCQSPEYVVNVWSLGNGYVAVNSRTLYCYVEAGFSWIPINVVGEFTGRRTFGTVRVRAPPPVFDPLFAYY